jgi:hypothetical protein
MTGPIIVHSMAEARAAVVAAAVIGCPVTLISAAAAGTHGGAGWFRALIEAAVAGYPTVAVTAVLDCADLPGSAQAAIRAGVGDLRFTGPPELTARLSAIAAAAGLRLHDAEAFGGPRLDLRGVADPVTACRQWLTAGLAPDPGPDASFSS